MPRGLEIQNKSVLHAVADFFGIGAGGNRMPSIMANEAVQPVAVLNWPISNRTAVAQVNTVALAGVAFQDQPIIHDANASGNPVAGAPTLVNTGLDTRVLTIAVVLNFDAAGALAFNGKGVNLYISTSDKTVPATGGMLTAIKPAWLIATAQLTYRFALWGYREALSAANQFGVTGWPALVPAEHSMTLKLEVADGTNFPANTLVSYTVMGLQVLKGQNLPY